jgi:hypothetical protein
MAANLSCPDVTGNSDSLRQFVSFQHSIAQTKRAFDCRTNLDSLTGAIVRRISRSQSREIILEYEWLGTIGRAIACYGLFLRNELLGVANFGWPAGIASRDICGADFRELAICLERGACVYWAPKNAASYLISRATKIARCEFGWKIFYAYADEDAGEIGVVYQACNWYYIGCGCGRDPGRLREDFVDPSGKVVSGRALRRRKLKKRDVLQRGWQVIYSQPKHKYVWFEGTSKERARFLKLCRYPFQSYPKRHGAFPLSSVT